jgi:hypothetical protein
VIKLSNFISNYIFKHGKENKVYIISSDEILKSIDIKNILINRIIIDYKDNNRKLIMGQFDLFKSKKIGDKYDIYLKLNTVKKSVIYHEINHVLQYMKLGKVQMSYLNRLSIANIALKNNFKSDKIKYILFLLYRMNDLEISSNVVQFYGQVKGLIKKYFKNEFKEYNDDKDKKLTLSKIYFKKTLSNKEIYRTAISSKIINFDHFLKDVDEDEIKKMISILYLIDNGKYPGVLNIDKNYNIIDIDYLDDILIESGLRKYNKYLNYQGDRLVKKLYKVWFLIEKDIINDKI